MKKISPFLPIVLILSLLALLSGLWAGLLRLGWPLPGLRSSLAPDHGPLMISGFLGALITVERVVALKKTWMFAAPVLTGLGWIAGLALPQTSLGPLLITLGSLGTMIILGIIVRREPVLHTEVIASGAVCWLVGNLLWLSGLPIYRIVLWWAAFLVLTITGERLELSRVLRMTPLKKGLFILAAGLFFAGVVVELFALQVGARLAGLGLIGLALWLVIFDIARRNLNHALPLTRYIARCLFAGYFWLGFGGLLLVWQGGTIAGLMYDATLHSIFIGFVISMIFGHAPIILPAVLNRMLPYHPAFYVSLALLHLSLLVRVGGDLGGWESVRQWGGLFNEVAILLFLAFLVITLRTQTRRPAVAG